MKRIKTNARGNWELYLEHVNKRNSLRIRIRVRTNVKFRHSTRIRVRVGIRVRIRQCKSAIIQLSFAKLDWIRTFGTLIFNIIHQILLVGPRLIAVPLYAALPAPQQLKVFQKTPEVSTVEIIPILSRQGKKGFRMFIFSRQGNHGEFTSK